MTGALRSHDISRSFRARNRCLVRCPGKTKTIGPSVRRQAEFGADISTYPWLIQPLHGRRPSFCKLNLTFSEGAPHITGAAFTFSVHAALPAPDSVSLAGKRRTDLTRLSPLTVPLPQPAPRFSRRRNRGRSIFSS